MRFIFILCLGFLSVSLLSVSVAQAACYSPEMAEADQGIRIHSELMVIGLNCQHMSKRHDGDNLYLTYREFTAEHADLFAEYEQKLIAFYEAQGQGVPEKRLNDLRTGYANKISEDAAKLRPDVFCSQYAPRVNKAAGMSRENLKEWAGTIFPSHPVSYPLCEIRDN